MPVVARAALVAVLFACGAVASVASIFGPDEPLVTPAPAEVRRLPLSAETEVRDVAVAPGRAEVAVVTSSGGEGAVLLWDLSDGTSRRVFAAVNGVAPTSAAWHPDGERLFVAVSSGGRHEIGVLDAVRTGTAAWRRIAGCEGPVSRLVVAPRPFVTAYPPSGEGEPTVEYRLFYAEERSGKPLVMSVTERGERPYAVVGPRPGSPPDPPGTESPASEIASPEARPEGVHPAGHLLLWVDGSGCHHVAPYFHWSWGESRPLAEVVPCGGTLAFTPNGAGLLLHDPAVTGVTLVLDRGKTRRRLAEGTKLELLAGATADGRGIVGVAVERGARVLVYEPVDLPLHDVANAWMFLESPRDADLLQEHGGLMRPLDLEQLYGLYETEAYACGDYDRTTPTRPYLVTTDLFWELYASAFEGVMVLRERRRAMPAFWSFVREARAHFGRMDHATRWTAVFATLDGVGGGEAASQAKEIALVLASSGTARSEALGEDFDYAELAPRGHYGADPELSRYFRAFKYLTRVPATEDEMGELAALPAAVRRKALDWIGAYAPFVAPPRAPLLWDPAAPPATWCRYPVREPRLFPLSWGFDNEALDAVVYHAGRPEKEQIRGPGGPRLLPSGRDLAAALGSSFARRLLAPEIAAYPALGPVLDDLALRSGPATATPRGLYERWIGALAVQWADGTAAPGSASDALWRTKRLQTGLAAWATVRHATVLVNERGEAECGEGGFEEIVLAPPRGSVEPDPATFAAIAGLFEETIALVKADAGMAALVVTDPYQLAGDLDGGVLRRLQDARDRVRRFEGMARRVQKGEGLTDGDQEEILYVARAAEHGLKVFKSLSRADLALSNPDPMSRVADVYGSGATGYLHVAVGAPVEWDLVLPHRGRRQVVKGAVYGYYELTGSEILDDATWAEREPDAARPEWVRPFMSTAKPTCPPPDPF